MAEVEALREVMVLVLEAAVALVVVLMVETKIQEQEITRLSILVVEVLAQLLMYRQLGLMRVEMAVQAS